MDKAKFGPLGLPLDFHLKDWPFLKERRYSYGQALGASIIADKSKLTDPDERIPLLLLCAELMAAQDRGHLSLDLTVSGESAKHETSAGIPDASIPGLLQIPRGDNAEDLLKKSGICQTVGETGSGEETLVLIRHSGRIYLYTRAFYVFESRFMKLIQSHAGIVSPEVPVTTVKELETWIDALPEDIRPDSQQKKAVFECLKYRFFTLTGGPGTGKTTTVFHMLRGIWHAEGQLRIALAAPTGRAARRMEESLLSSLTRCQSFMLSLPDTDFAGALRLLKGRTIHRLVGIASSFVKSKKEPAFLPYDVLVVDEASMIDVVLMSRLIERLDPNTRLILVGDHRQLPSIEAGAILGDIVSRERMSIPIGTTKLTKTFRFSGLLAETAHKVLEGQGKEVLDDLSRNSPRGEVELLTYNRGPQVHATREILLEQYAVKKTGSGDFDLNFVEAAAACDFETNGGVLKKIPNAPALSLTDRIDLYLGELFGRLSSRIILSPFKAGVLGTEAINRRILERIAASQGVRLFARNGAIWIPGMPVMSTKNDYERGLFNGDRGIVYKNHDGQLRAWFPSAGPSGSPARFAPQTITGLEPAYAITIHKSQGSEFDEVILVLSDNRQAGPDSETILTRELIYTAITRARRALRIVTDTQSILEGCAQRTHRNSLIGSFLDGSYIPD